MQKNNFRLSINKKSGKMIKKMFGSTALAGGKN